MQEHPTQIGSVGFSGKTSDPAFLLALQKQRKKTLLWGAVLICAPLLVGGGIALSQKSSAPLLVGTGVAIVFAVANLVSFLNHRLRRDWEGTLLSKKTATRTRHRKDHSTVSRTEYISTFETDTGKVRKITESASFHPCYDDISEGERVRYHARLGYCEKYDKSRESTIRCAVCKQVCEIANDNCPRCGAALLK